MRSFSDLIIDKMESGRVPSPLILLAVKVLSAQRLWEQWHWSIEQELNNLLTFKRSMITSDIAILQEKANEQHYEVPAEFFLQVLGPRRKYSSALFEPSSITLSQAEEMMLALTCDRAEIKDGMEILELGVGWGSLTLWMAEKYPNSRILGISNSHSQREYILAEAKKKELGNVTIQTADITHFETHNRFDRVISVEMFEHLRNWQNMFSRVRDWLKVDGKLFIHIFCHKKYAYSFETSGATNWMGRHFFSGGIMPSDRLPYMFAEHLTVENQWRINGRHYAKTAKEWRKNMERNKSSILPILAGTYGETEAERWFNRWKMFFIGCEGMFGFALGREWWVSHYLLKPTI